MTMPDWFQRLQPRERWVLGAGSVAVAVLIVWGLIWTPLSNASERLQASVADKQGLLIGLQRVDALPATGPSTGAPRAQSQSLLVLVERTQQAHGLTGAFTQTRPDGTDAIDVTFQNASFDALLGWLIALQTEHGVTVESASFGSTREPGLVSGRLFLRRS